jgi:hypothetical protein
MPSALLTADELAAERAFTALCDRYHAVGVWEGKVVRFTRLKAASINPLEQQVANPRVQQTPGYYGAPES